MGSYYHMRVWKLKKLQKCPHLVHLDPPQEDVEPPSLTSLRTHKATFHMAKKNPDMDPEAFRSARDN